MNILSRKNVFLITACLVSFILGSFISNKAEEEKLTVSMIKEAQKLFGLNFTDSEADSMLSNLEAMRKNYPDIRKLGLDNSIAPPLYFNPMPSGYKFPDRVNSFKIAPLTIKLPAERDSLAFYTVRELAELIRTRKITSTELTVFFLERLKKYNGKLQNVITFTDDIAMQQAAKADEEIKAGKYKGLLHGIPYGLKDLVAVKGYKTTWGSVPFQEQVINTDATVYRRLEKAGAVLLAKLTLGELAVGDEWFGGKTKNPWDIRRGSSGSSAGSASAVAAGCLPFAIGSETLGSIVLPSSECGTTGLRPTFGRVSRYGAMTLSWSMDKLGPITRSVEDLAIVFNAIQGADNKDMSVIPAPFSYTSPVKGLRGVKIGYLKTDFERSYGNKTNDSITLVTLKSMGAELVPVTLPDLPYAAMRRVLSAESSAVFEELTLSNRDDLMRFQNKTARPNTLRSYRFMPAVEYIQANRARSLLITQLNKALKGLDLYMAPTLGNNLTATNLSGHPCIVLPNGFIKGLPASITFMGQLFGEGKLLYVAQVYQQGTKFHKQHPSMTF